MRSTLLHDSPLILSGCEIDFKIVLNTGRYFQIEPHCCPWPWILAFDQLKNLFQLLVIQLKPVFELVKMFLFKRIPFIPDELNGLRSQFTLPFGQLQLNNQTIRSEERRVGKDSRSGGRQS